MATSRFSIPEIDENSDLLDGPDDINAALAVIDDNMAGYDQGTSLPSAGTAGKFFYRTDTGQIFFDTGAAWVEPGTWPGDIKATARATAPAGWLICDGSAVSRSTYATLFGLIGTAYGVGNGSTTFNLPDLRERVPVGAGASGVDIGRFDLGIHNNLRGGTGGEGKHTLTTAEMPAHTHGGGTINSTSYAGMTAGATNQLSDVSFSGMASAGGGDAHNNVQPYQIVNWLVKT